VSDCFSSPIAQQAIRWTKCVAFCSIIAVSVSVRAGNPIVVGQGLTDPKVRIYGERAYLYATHDASAQSKTFLMNDWWTCSSDDLVHWKYQSALKPEQTYWASPAMSAGRPMRSSYCQKLWMTPNLKRRFSCHL
jgi:hypothetical protein